VRTHELPQRLHPSGQDTVHWPRVDEHEVNAFVGLAPPSPAHVVPHALQLLDVENGVAHPASVPLQATSPKGHVVEQFPATQEPAQMAPHAPQLVVDDVKSTQRMPHAVRGGGQVLMQPEAPQYGAALEHAPPSPQLAGLVMSVSHPFEAL